MACVSVMHTMRAMPPTIPFHIVQHFFCFMSISSIIIIMETDNEVEEDGRR